MDVELDSVRKQEEILADELELEQQLSLAPTLRQVASEEFPLFLTVRRLLFMVDGCFARSFFVRNAKGESVGQTSASQWHNENKGVMLINRYFKAAAAAKEKQISGDLANLNEALQSSED